MRYQDLSKEIKQNIFHPVYLFTGPEQYVADMMEKKLIASTISPETALLNLKRFSEKDTSADDILSMCEQFPMMNPYRMVIVDSEAGFLSGKTTTEQEKIIKYLQDPAPSTILVINEKKPDKRTKFIKTILSHVATVEFEKLQRSELEKWIRARFKKANMSADRNTISFFIDRIMYPENDALTMSTVDNELNKVIDFCAGKSEITERDIAVTLPQSIDDNIFHMIDHVMSGKTADALMMLNHFYLDGEDPIGIFALILSQLRTMLQIKFLSQQHTPPQEIASQVKRPLFVVKKLQQTASKFQGNRLLDLIDEAALLDWQIKTGVADATPAVELFLIKMTIKK